MTNKDKPTYFYKTSLTDLIKVKGFCEKTKLRCSSCVLVNVCKSTITSDQLYYLALNEYIELYGQTELMQALLI